MDGNIMATIIRNQVTRNSPAPSMAIPPMPTIKPACCAVSNHAEAAQTRSAAVIAVATGRGIEPAPAGAGQLNWRSGISLTT
jgi:hypothetical protein